MTCFIHSPEKVLLNRPVSLWIQLGFLPPVTWRPSPVFALFTAHFTDFSGISETAVKAGLSFKIHYNRYLNCISFSVHYFLLDSHAISVSILGFAVSSEEKLSLTCSTRRSCISISLQLWTDVVAWWHLLFLALTAALEWCASMEYHVFSW